MLPPFLLSRLFLQRHPIVPTATAGVPLPLCQFTSHLHHLSTRTHAHSKASPLLFSPGYNPGTEARSPFLRPLQSAPCHNPPALPCLFVETSLRVWSIFSILPLGGMNLVAWSSNCVILGWDFHEFDNAERNTIQLGTGDVQRKPKVSQCTTESKLQSILT